jgi:hypothetical protein
LSLFCFVNKPGCLPQCTHWSRSLSFYAWIRMQLFMCFHLVQILLEPSKKATHLAILSSHKPQSVFSTHLTKALDVHVTLFCSTSKVLTLSVRMTMIAVCHYKKNCADKWRWLCENNFC